MRNSSLTFGIVITAALLCCQFSFAQWNLNGPNLENTNSGDVVIGNTSNLRLYGRLISYYPKSDVLLAGEFLGTNGYWGFRTGTDNAFNLDIWNGGQVKSAFNIAQNGNVGIGGAADANFKVKVQGEIVV